MATIEQVKNGFKKYIENEFLTKISDPTKKMLVNVVSELFFDSPNLKNIVKNPMFLTLGVVDEAEQIDVEKLKNVISKWMPTEGIDMDFPLIGKAKFKTNDVEVLYGYICEK